MTKRVVVTYDTSSGAGGVSLGETSTTAYRGDRGKTAYDHSQVVNANPHATTAAQVGAIINGENDDTATLPSNNSLVSVGVTTWDNGGNTENKAYVSISMGDQSESLGKATLLLDPENYAEIGKASNYLRVTNTGYVLGSASGFRTALGLGSAALSASSAFQAADTELTAIAGLTSAANKGIYFTGSGTAATFDLTAAGLALLDDADASAQRTTLGLSGFLTVTNAGAYNEYLTYQNTTATTGTTEFIIRVGAANPASGCAFRIQANGIGYGGADIFHVSNTGAVGVFGDHVSVDQNQLRIAMYSDHHRCGYDSHGIAWYDGTILGNIDVCIMRGHSTISSLSGAVQVNNGTLNTWRDVWARDYVTYLTGTTQTNYVRGRISCVDNGSTSSMNLTAEVGGSGFDTTATVRVYPTGMVNSNGLEIRKVGGGLVGITSAGSNFLMVSGSLCYGTNTVGFYVDSGGRLTSDGGYTLAMGPTTVTQIAADTNNWALGANIRHYRVSSDASRNVTGISIGQLTGQEFFVWNVGSFNIVFKNEDASSTAANRILTPSAADFTLVPGGIAFFVYDGTSSRFRVK